jgi:monovalent cation:H+ antiporter-2, CPA2 family
MNGHPIGEFSLILIELGAIIMALAVLARLAHKVGISPIPFYLMAGLALGRGGVVSLELSEHFIYLGADIGVILLMFVLGLEYTADRLSKDFHSALPAGLKDLVVNFAPGVVFGLVLGWDLLPALLLGGVVYISSSGIIAKLLTDLNRVHNGETPTIMSILVLEDIAMAIYLPLMTILLIGQGLFSGLLAILIGGTVGGAMLFVALHYGKWISRLIGHRSNEIVLLSAMGMALLFAGIGERLQLSAAVGAFIAGITLSGEVAERTHRLIGPLRDLFAAIFFLFFGLAIDPMTLGPVLVPALLLGLITGAAKVLTGWWATDGLGLSTGSRLRAGVTLIARGEFSLVIAMMGISAGLDPQLGTLSAAYVLFTAIAGPLLLRVVEPQLARATKVVQPRHSRSTEGQHGWLHRHPHSQSASDHPRGGA